MFIASIAAGARSPDHRIAVQVDSTSKDQQGSSSSSHDLWEYVERIVAVRTDGVEIVYDLPSSATEQERAAEWMFPARVFRAFDGSLKLLNREEMEARVKTF